MSVANEEQFSLKARYQKSYIVPDHVEIGFNLTRAKRIYVIILKLIRFIILFSFYNSSL
jgi:hypothetical protein